MKIATWNINGIKARLEGVVTWLEQAKPDIACLQEITSVDEGFPSERFEELGYNVAVHGQKSFNGVALLSKKPFDEVTPRLPGDDADEQARYLEGVVSTDGGALRVASIYLPNGNPIDGDKFAYKLAWMERLYRHVQTLLASEDVFVLGGDYNVAPDDDDVYDPRAWRDDALCRPESRAALRKIVFLGLTDALRAVSDEGGRYTWWDYRGGAWPQDKGLRIDHLLLSPAAADRLGAAGIDRHVRAWEKPSDHVPVWIDLAIEVK